MQLCPLFQGFSFQSFIYPLWTEVWNIKWKIPEIKNSSILNCALFQVAWWNLVVPPRVWIVFCPAYPQCNSLPVSHIASCSGVTATTKGPLFNLLMAPECNSSCAGNSDVPKKKLSSAWKGRGSWLDKKRKKKVWAEVAVISNIRRYFEREREREREKEDIYVTFIIVYCSNAILLLITIMDLLFCPIYKLNFIVGVFV